LPNCQKQQYDGLPSSCSFNKKFDRLQTKIDVYIEKAQLIK